MPGHLITIIALAVIGMINTSYLVIKKIKRQSVWCPFFPQEWCDKVNDSPQSKTFGFPNSLAGLYMYSGILVLSLFFYHAIIPFWPIFTLVVIGFCFSTYFLYVQKVILKAFCTWCVLSAVEFTLLLILSLFKSVG